MTRITHHEPGRLVSDFYPSLADALAYANGTASDLSQAARQRVAARHAESISYGTSGPGPGRVQDDQVGPSGLRPDMQHAADHAAAAQGQQRRA